MLTRTTLSLSLSRINLLDAIDYDYSHTAYYNPNTMRLPYVPDPPPTSTPEEARILSSVQARRAPNPLLPLDLALLHSFPVADGWNSFIGAIRTRTTLSTVIRELAICRVAVINGALFEWE
ncbi:unnamed protein product [Penicillium manginii]